MSDIVAFGEYRNGEVREITHELITAALRLAEQTGGEAHAAIVDDGDIPPETLQQKGLREVHLIDYPGGYTNAAFVDVISQFIEQNQPNMVLLPHTVTGMDYAPAVASRLGRTLVTNAVNVTYDGELKVTRKMYGGKVDCTVGVEGTDVVLTLRGGQFPAADQQGDVKTTRFEPDPEDHYGTEVLELSAVDLGDDVDITNAEFIVSIGLGVGEEENMDLVRELVDKLDATLASSRPIVERGWLPRSRQVGQSGETVNPRVYVAIGISGAIEHRVGMKGSDTIIAINNDPDAPIFNLADHGIVGDLNDVVPELIAQCNGES